jgi:hypothetical protein
MIAIGELKSCTGAAKLFPNCARTPLKAISIGGLPQMWSGMPIFGHPQLRSLVEG